jgi:hypothetical protein
MTSQLDPKSDERFMRLAIKEASRALGRTAPNPAVGAVLVKGGKVIAKGHHRAASQRFCIAFYPPNPNGLAPLERNIRSRWGDCVRSL